MESLTTDAPLEGSQHLQRYIDKLTENQNSIISKFEALTSNVEEMRGLLAQFAAKICTLEESVTSRNAEELGALRKKVNELYHMLKEGRDDSFKIDANDTLSCHSKVSTGSKVAMTTGLDREMVRSAYEDVRSDATPTEWAIFKFEGARIVCAARGSDFTEFRTHFADDERAFGYLRLQMGDEMSKRRKFLLVTWIGPHVSVINRAKMSTDKAIIKDVISNFAVELQLESQAEIDIDQFKEALIKAGGANYGTGVRDL